MGERLKNSPIIEVACEFKFEDISEDLTIYGDFHTKLGEKYEKMKQKTYQDIVIRTSKGKIEQTSNNYSLQQFIDKKNNVIIQAGQNVLIINKLKPYESWIKFSPLIADSFRNYTDITRLQKIKRIGLKYINQINFNENEIKIEDYLLFRPEINNKLGPVSGHFISGAEFFKNNNQDVLRITLTDNPPTKDFPFAFILDFDYNTIVTDNLTVKNSLDWVEKAHGEIEKAFFNCITNKLRGIFKK